MELLYVICQLAAAEVCEDHRVALIGAPPMACVYSAPAELARLVRPGWRIARWSCGEDPETRASDLSAAVPTAAVLTE